MSKIDMKNQIASAYKEATPDMLQGILDACKETTQEPFDECAPVRTQKNKISYWPRIAVAVASMALVLFAGMQMGQRIAPNQNVPQTKVEPIITDAPAQPVQVATVYIDVNPSIEMQIDENMQTMDCVAANEDATAILEGLNLENVDMSTSIQAVAGSLFLHGYLQDQNDAMLISIETNDTAAYWNISASVNTVFAENSIDCKFLVLPVVGDNIKERANANGISVGKMVLIDKIIADSDDLTEEDEGSLIDVAVSDLNGLLQIIEQGLPTDSIIPRDDTGVIVTDALDGLGEIVGATTDATGTIIQDATDATGTIVQDATDATGTIVQDATDAAGTIIQDATGAADGIISDAIDTTGNIVGGITGGLDGLIGGFFH